MLSKEFYYQFKGVNYLVHIDFKGIKQKKNYYRLRGETLYISANSLTSMDSIKNSLDDVFDKLLLKTKKRDYFNEDGVYIFGELISTKDGFFKFNGRSYLFKDKLNFYETIKKFALDYFKSRVSYYSKVMGVKTIYNVKLKNAVSRYGSNSSATNTIMLNLILIHYSQEIIDSVIIHELAHDFQRNHSKKFYEIVEHYCPRYKELDYKLERRIFK